MMVYLNSEITTIPDEVDTVEKLLNFKNIPTKGIAVGINNKIIEAKNFSVSPIKNEDRILVITATFGG